MKAIIGATVHSVSGPVIPGGVVLIDQGRIVAIGADIPVPADAEVTRADGMHLIPGIVEPHCHVGVFDWGMDGESGKSGNGGLSEAVTPALDYLYALNPRAVAFRDAIAGGVTTLLTGPGSGKVVSGQSIVLKTAGRNRRSRILKAPAGVKMAFGENPKGNFGRRGIMPETRMGTAALLRNALEQAKNYMNRQELASKAHPAAGDDAAAKPSGPPAVDFALEALAKVLRGELIARVHAHRADDIMTILRIRDEYGFRMTLEHATEAYKVKDEIARRGIPCVTGPSFGSRDKVELRDETFANPGILERAGIKTAITTDAPIVGIEYLRTEASIAHREGMSAAGALRAITLTPAEIIGVEGRVGSIEAGKDADLVLLSDEPLSFLSRVERVWVDGAPVYERSTWREDWQKD